MQIVNISEAKAQLSASIAKVATGKEVLISKAGTPVAKTRALRPQRLATPTRSHAGQDQHQLRFRRVAR